MSFQDLQGFMDQLTQVQALALCIVHEMSQVLVFLNVKGKCWQDLPIVGDLSSRPCNKIKPSMCTSLTSPRFFSCTEDTEDTRHQKWKKILQLRHKCLANHVTAEDQRLQDLENCANNRWILSVESHLHGDDELRNHRQDLGTTSSKHVISSSHCKETIWILLLSKTFKENGQEMMIVQPLQVNFPSDLSSNRAMKD